MMTFYAAAGSYQIRSEDGKNMPYIMRLGKLQPVSIPEFSLWSKMIWVFDETYAFGNEYISSSLDDENKFVWKWPNRVLASVVPQRSTDIAVVLQLTEDHDDDGCEWLVKVEWAIVDDDGYADYRRFFIDDGFAPDLFTEDGLQNILLSKRKRFDAFLRDNQPYAPKCSRIKGNPRDWYICPKTHDWHNNQCRECQNNLINEFRTGTDYRQGGLFFYCAYPRIIHEADKYGEVHLPSIRF